MLHCLVLCGFEFYSAAVMTLTCDLSTQWESFFRYILSGIARS